MINIILFGPPGSGKGTQADILGDKYNFLHISTGDLFRSEIGNETELGLKAQDYMSKGNLVPDEVTIGMLKNKVLANQDVEGFIFDGFPRTGTQCTALNNLLGEMDEKVGLLLALDVDDEEIVKRLLKRGETSGRADDRNEEVIRKRIEVYNEETALVYDFYDKLGVSAKISGVGDIPEISARISSAIDAVM